MTTYQAGAMSRKCFGSVCSPMEKLPVETLSSIFQLTILPPITFPNEWFDQTKTVSLFPVALGAVSTHWRKVAWSTPSLWTSFRFDKSLRTRGRHNPRLLLLYLQNSGVLPIRLAIVYNDRDVNGPLFDASVDPALLTNMWRIEMLVLELPPEDWFDHLGKLSAMTDFWASWGNRHIEEQVFFNRCRSLRHLSLIHFEDTGGGRFLHKLPWSITVLRLSRIPTDTCIKLLLRCPKLVEITFLFAQPPHDEFEPLMESSWFGEPIVYEDLETLIWKRSYCDWTSLFLQHTRMPSLRRLRLIDDFAGGRVDTEGETHFLPRIAPTLSVLELRDTSCIAAGSSYWTLFDSNVFIDSLVFDHCEVEIIIELVRRLTPPEGETQGLKPMPRLKFLSIELCNYGVTTPLPVLLPRDSDPLVLMLERRLVAGDAFRLEFWDMAVDWTPAAQKRLRKLVEKGIRLEIIEDSDEVDWLRPLN
ncbi:hypothetical protein P691DRAFT_567082 [Macrolepiota fuliginosa MF-IS2]|uniref:F-box domain-containing protein n=1 Tax=Macrolepiota fuliginosa MF-IS2 TaxID=1400762 RepID=A0A9P5XH17_9AGAR|nr:hypothetical protein P691DRAFT_567082 [Macrolepiota fuliginosa MF-IS2]